MKNIILRGMVLVLFAMTALSCAIDEDDELSILGVWEETAPVPGRTTLIFAPNNRLTRIDQVGNREVYNYRIEDRKLFLSLVSGLEGSAELLFEQINENKIKVENLYGSIPEAERTFIIFERKN